ncbi:SDR family oxidoreductase [Adhaeribacter radiodurans]|uniref:SDR family oxidoreductase n=1 Tax=Adhaeribacter radiodurans TaxID=2745197 RepID=A0A7L7L2D6_9BACT|nr:SDR family oxidoreductase [Adhaeribacter radiodurans]QMU26755.1 SDR family oxidoreductase [Adhaeribacter radiodurans]
MKVLVTGATGYIGKRLVYYLVSQGHEVYASVRDRNRFPMPESIRRHVQIQEADFLDTTSLINLPIDIDVAFYLIHSMSASYQHFNDLEEKTALNFTNYIATTTCKQIIYLGGIANDAELSRHLNSRRHVEEILATAGVPVTVLRAAIIIGSGSASFEIIRDLVEKLPVMIAPKWLKSRCQPIGIRNVIEYLTGVMGNPETHNKVFDIGSSEILTYKQMLAIFAQVRGLKRWIISVPVLSPRLSSYWLYFVTSTSFALARSLVDSMKNEVICQNLGITEIVPLRLMTYKESVELAFARIDQNEVASSWKDSFSNSESPIKVTDFIQVPEEGCFKDKRDFVFSRSPEAVLNNIFRIGGLRGWYYLNSLWRLRGFIDKLFGGVGLRRGRTNLATINPGDALDFWRVLHVDKVEKRLLLYAEMKLPGEAWLEFKIENQNQQNHLIQTATFRPKGILGRLYWYSVLPFHYFIFNGMARNIIHYGE